MAPAKAGGPLHADGSEAHPKGRGKGAPKK